MKLVYTINVFAFTIIFQWEQKISRYDAVLLGRSLGPLVKTRALRDDAS